MRIDIEIPDDAVRGRYGVYVAFDAAGDVLYIGMTMNLPSRLNQHRSQSAWFKSTRSLEWCPCDGPNEARSLEKALIAEYRPESNTNDWKILRDGRHSLPDWSVERLVLLHEAERAAFGHHREDNARERQALNSYIRSLRAAGWSLAAIGKGLGMTREGVRLRTLDGTGLDRHSNVPAVPVKQPKAKKVWPQIPPDRVAKMLELKALAMQCRGWTPEGHAFRVSSERYSELIAEAYVGGVSIYRISKQMGVTHLAIRARLARHGYMEPVKGLDQPAYGTPFVRGGTKRSWAGGECFRGHDVTDPTNVRYVNGDPERPVCRECERVRVRRYRNKQKVVAA